ncbi:hypothetical protein [Rhodoferax sp. BLA1]|uniref:hypothetical protein n=1 Tax=Rhodoferax sp. BLA1 TaxID=2576062 RepID=UPI0015D2A1BB|nr:hypothetical protein [Rhodoferax sp. BLA1]
MPKIQIGDALLHHGEKGEPSMYCRVIYIDLKEDLACVMRIPGKNKAGYQKNYVMRPLFLSLSALQAQVDELRLSVTEFPTPSHWLLTPAQLRANKPTGAIGKTRRDLRKWVRVRAKAYGRIRPFVHGRGIDEIIMDPSFSGWPAKRAQELGLHGASQVQRDLNAYLLAMGLRGGLLPWFTRNGGSGKPKLSTRKTGRPTEFSGAPKNQLVGKNCNLKVRQIFAMGWRKFKKPGVSVQTAFTKTLNSWFAKSVAWNGTSAKVALKPEAFKFTAEQFSRWGRAGEDALTPTQIEQGETAARRTYLRRQNKMKDRFLSANGEAFLDSTSTDQTLVSSASRLKVLSAPWRTDVMGASIDYIFGHHVGFESPSAMTALLSILHAAEDKVGYCARYGIKIAPRDWHSMTFKKILTDNGEGKGQLSLKTLEEIESGASFGPAYDAINKAPLESGHRRTQKQLDHQLPGSTMGRRKRRGEPDRSVMARLNFFEYMPRLIERVLHHNNVERIVLPSLEMRRDDVEPTRRGVLEWLLEKGYVSSSPVDLQALRVKSLPLLQGSMQADGLHLFDPTFAGKRLIPNLAYRSDWLMRSGMLAKSAMKRVHLDVHLNPSDLSQVWVNLNGLKCLTLVSADPDMLELCLLDWLIISRDDRLKGFLSRVDETKQRSNQVASIDRDVKKANRERNAEIKQRGTPLTKNELKANRRDNTAVESAVQTGLPKPPKHKLPGPMADIPSANTPQIANPIPSAKAGMGDVISALYKDDES